MVVVRAVATGLVIAVLGNAGAVAVAAEPHAGLRIQADISDTKLAAAGAITDDLEAGVRRVLVRVVDEMDLEIRFEATRPMTLFQPLSLCLVGPYAAPDDAGLSDRCWGEPDVGAVVASAMGSDAGRPIRLEPGDTVVVETTIARGHERCDYPPGDCRLEIAFDPPGPAGQPDDVVFEDVPLEVPWATIEPLPLLDPRDSRYCGLAGAVLRDQGEPDVIEVIDPDPAPMSPMPSSVATS
jgi:hypothetical protein